MSKKITIVYHSGYGHTEVIAKSVLKGCQSVSGVEATLISTADAPGKAAALEASDAIVFGTPTYMGSVSAKFKEFMDWSSKAWMEQKWKNKIAAGFTVSGSPSGDKLNTLQTLAIFAGQHGMIWVGQTEMPGQYSGKTGADQVNRLGSFLGLMSQADNAPADKTPPAEDHKTAEIFGARIAWATKSWNPN